MRLKERTKHDGSFTPNTGHHRGKLRRLQWADIVAKVEKLEVAKIDARAGVRRKRHSQASPRGWGSPWW
jgi:hypothetical protein